MGGYGGGKVKIFYNRVITHFVRKKNDTISYTVHTVGIENWDF